MRFRQIVYMLLVFTRAVGAQVPEYTHHVTRSFGISAPVSIEISNKYGRVQVIPWDKDSVRFDIDLRIKAKDKQKLEKIRQNIEFEFTPAQYFIIARTKFGESGSDVLQDLVDIAGSYFSSSNAANINYTVRIPSHLNLKIENKFGDVYIDDHSGSVNITLSYGDLKANRLNGQSNLNIKQGDADINYIKDATVTFSYVNARIREISMLNIQSQSSVVTIEKSGNLKLNSRHDKLYLNDVNFLSGEAYFSQVNIGVMNNSVTLNGRYGDIIMDQIRRSFTTLTLTSELTDISLSFERPLAFGFDLTHHQSVLLTYPKDLAHLSPKLINAEQKIFSTSGNFGSGSSSRVIIKALRKCNLTISQR